MSTNNYQEDYPEDFYKKVARQISDYKLLRDEVSSDQITVLYIDDEPDALRTFKLLFRFDFKLFTTTSIEEAKNILNEQDIQVVISDQRMPQMSGVAFFSQLAEEHPHPVRILLTGYSDIDAVIDAINMGKVYFYASKPYKYETLKCYIENAAEVYTLRKEREKIFANMVNANEQLEFMLRQKLLG